MGGSTVKDMLGTAAEVATSVSTGGIVSYDSSSGKIGANPIGGALGSVGGTVQDQTEKAVTDMMMSQIPEQTDPQEAARIAEAEAKKKVASSTSTGSSTVLGGGFGNNLSIKKLLGS